MWHSCELDQDNCLDLSQILKVFSAPITEEHAWALVHQVYTLYIIYYVLILILEAPTAFDLSLLASIKLINKGLRHGLLKEF